MSHCSRKRRHTCPELNVQKTFAGWLTRVLPVAVLLLIGPLQPQNAKTDLTVIDSLLEYSRYQEAIRLSRLFVREPAKDSTLYLEARFRLLEGLERTVDREGAGLQFDTLAALLKSPSPRLNYLLPRLDHHRGRLRRMANDLPAADSLLQMALRGYRQADPQAREVAVCLNELGTIALRRGQLELAMTNYRRALFVFQQQETPIPRDIAIVFNHIGLIYMRRGQQDSTNHYFSAALEMLIDRYGEQHFDTGMLYGNMAIAADMRGHHNQAAEFCHKALQIIDQTAGQQHALYSSVMNTLGVVYKNLADYDRAVEAYQHALRLRQLHYPELHFRISQSYQNIGTVHLLAGDYGLAHDYYLRAFEINQQILPGSSNRLAWNYKDLGRAKYRLGNLEQALQYYRKSLEIYVEAYGGEEHGDIAIVYNRIGQIYLDLQQPQEAFRAFNRDLEIQQDIGRSDHPNLAAALIDICRAHLAAGETAIAKPFLAKGLAVYRRIYSESHPAILQAKLLKAEMLTGEGEYGDAMAICNEALALSDGSENRELAFRAHLQKARLYRQMYQSSPKVGPSAFIDSALSGYQAAVDQLEQLRWHLNADRSKLVWRSNWNTIYMEALSLLQENREDQGAIRTDQHALEIMESGTASLLREIVRESRARQVAGVPDSLLAEERRLSNRINAAQNHFVSVRSAPESQPAVLAAARGALQDLHQQRQILIDKLERQYPQYYQLKYDSLRVGLDELQGALSEEEALLYYATHERQVAIMAISRFSSHLALVKHDTSLSADIEAFLGSLRKISHWPRWQELSSKLYQTLIAPVQTRLQGKKRLIIVTGTELTQIPFETLISRTNNNPHGTPHYLLQDFEVQYHYSASLFADSRHSPIAISPERVFAGFAPVFDSTLFAGEKINPYPLMFKTALPVIFRSEISPLPASENEVREIRKMFDRRFPENDLFLRHRASKKSFLEAAGRYRFLHLATHGLWQAENPARSGIYFSEAVDSSNREGGILYANDVYRLQLQAELTVLGSCESGEGEFVSGEGVLAISRGFYYAGSRNLLASLWKVPDRATAKLMIEFYRHFLGGASLSAALREAKLSALAAPQTVHPSAWGGFVLIGGS